MYQETSSKHSNLKKRANFAIGKSVNSSRDKFKTLDSKKKGFLGNDKRGQRRVKTDNIASIVDDELFKKRKDSVRSKNDNFRSKRVESDDRSFSDNKFSKTDNRGRGLKASDRKLRGLHDSEKQTWESHSKNRMSNKRESHDERGERRKNTENGENRSGFLRKNGEAKYDNSKQLRSPAEEHKFGKTKLQNKNKVSDDSVAMFDRPRRKRRLIRIEYPNDTANKRFDDTPPKIDDNTTEQKKDPDTDENTEMSKNAQFRAIQPSPSIISFVNENLLGRRREIEFKKAGYNIELSSPLDNIPFSTSSERERIEESVFRNKLAFFAAAKVSSSFPSPDLPEIAFAGRSNVGKSSLLNSLTRQWGVVRTSDKPGLTQTINFFNLGSKLCLVDLPGYGFAYAKEEVKESWEELVKEYVSTRDGLKRVCLLIDTKWGMKPRDHELVDLMERSKTKYQIVLTKTDLAFPVDVARRAMQIEESLKTKKSVVQPLMMVSSKTGAGIRNLRTVLSNISRFVRL